ncbi:MAG: hypothetical protein H0W72_05865 [Planctomycetes bacterium]|nr:hypothetical protein [Planctomycetota bacterium]
MAKAKESGAAKAKAKEAPAAKAKPKEAPKAAKSASSAAKPALNGKSAGKSAPTISKPTPPAKPVATAKPATGATKPATAATAKSAASKPATGATSKPATGAVAKSANSAPAKSANSAPAKPVNGAKAKPPAAPTAKGKEPAKPVNGKAVAPKAAAKEPTQSARDKAADRYRDVRNDGKPLVGLKCPFPSDELAKWREALLERRAEITNDIAGLVKDAMEAEDGHTTPNHIAERGSDADLQDMSLGMAGEEEEILWQIDRALRKIDNSSPIPYGLCEYTRDSIPRTRLQLLPWTPLSIEGAQHMEDSRLTLEDMLLDD